MHKYEIDHLRKLRKGLTECMVLLKNNHDFPLDGARDIALYGSGVRHTVKGGTGSGEVNSRFFETVEKGFKKSGFNITSKSWLDEYDVVLKNAHEKFVRQMKKDAHKAHMPGFIYAMGAVMPEPEYDIPISENGEVAIYVLSRISGEGSDRKPVKGDVLLTDTEIKDILYLNKNYTRFMLALNVGGPVDLTPVMEVENILILSQLGVQTGSALCDVVLGRTNPSGKLSTTWTSYDDYPAIGDFGNVNETRYKEGIYVGYRYFDSLGIKPLFPFGFGLSFTEFNISDTNVTNDNDLVKVNFKVSNIGEMKGKEVVQLYVSSPSVVYDNAYQELAGFTKTKNLLPDETQELSIEFSLSDIALYDEENSSYILEKGDYILRLGNSSRDTKTVGCIRLEENVTVKKVKNLLGNPDFDDYIPKKECIKNDREEFENSDKDVIILNASSFEPIEISYEKEYEIDEYVDNLTDESLALLSVGAFSPTGALSNVIGNQGFLVAGAAGESAAPWNLDFKPLSMADGPAGIRISQKYYRDEKGVHSIGSTLPETFEDYMPNISKALTALTQKRPKKSDVVKNQYATAIPIGVAIAQSFNCDFATVCGDIVGEEMEEFNIKLWLAPALNIHRNILCGRNFEYYSEDPYLSGMMAASITKGVQRHKSCGVTIKHFACNNQETNRYFNDSIVSERALRQIYLKGFEICIKNSHPKALMTSYNLLNGIHTSESSELTEDILRCEFGFDGIVMTDWVILGSKKEPGSIHSYPKANKVAKAGCELFMPGSMGDYKDILEALKDDDELRHQLKLNVTRLYKMTKMLNA